MAEEDNKDVQAFAELQEKMINSSQLIRNVRCGLGAGGGRPAEARRARARFFWDDRGH